MTNQEKHRILTALMTVAAVGILAGMLLWTADAITQGLNEQAASALCLAVGLAGALYFAWAYIDRTWSN